MPAERARRLGAREERGVGPEDRDGGDRAQGIDERVAIGGGPHRRPYCQPWVGRRGHSRSGWPASPRPASRCARCTCSRSAATSPAIGDWHFYHWQANLIADGHGFVEPYKWLFEHRASPSAGHPPLYPLALAAVSELGGTSELSHRALGLILGAVTIVLVGLLGRQRGRRPRGPDRGRAVRRLPADDRRRRGADERDALRPAGRARAARGVAADRPPRARVAAVVAGRGDRRRGAHALRGAAARAAAGLAGGVARRAAAGRCAALLATAGCALALAPWTIRNADRFGAFVPVSTNDSTVIAGANCPLTYAGIDLGGWNIRCISKRRDDNEARQAAIWRREGVDYATRPRRRAGRWSPRCAGCGCGTSTSRGAR